METDRYGAANRFHSSFGEIRRKRGDTLVRTLRREYGDHFAARFRADTTLADVLRKENVQSLSEYLRSNRPIIVTNRFASGHDAAKILGVPKSRADELINTAKRSKPVVSAVKGRVGSTNVEFKVKKPKTESKHVVFVAKRKRIGTHVGFKVKKAKAKR